MEPPLAVSTFCRKCSAHFKIKDGKAVNTKKEPYNPFANFRRNPETHQKPDQGISAESLPSRHSSTPTAPTSSPPSPTRVPANEAPSLKSGIFGRSPKQESRAVKCFDCKSTHNTSVNSTSALCPKCGSYISLKSYDIRENWNHRIQTRGDVFIHKKGIATVTTIQCHNLIVEGDFTGGVECSGDLTIRRHGRIMGKVVCRRLIIEKRAKVEFLNSIETDECDIDGLVTGDISCKGRLVLKKKAILTGDIAVGRLAISAGAKHQGKIQMSSSS